MMCKHRKRPKPRPKLRPSPEEIERLYKIWLGGGSLRSVASEHYPEASYSAIHNWFRDQYGPKATNKMATSLARSLMIDYENNPLHRDQVVDFVINLIKEGGLENAGETKFRSLHSLNQLGKFQVVHDPRLMDTLARFEEQDLEQYTWGWLRLHLAVYVFDSTAEILREYLC